MADGQLSVDLRLALRKLKEDIAAASKMIKEGLNKSLNIGGVADKGTKDSAAAMEKLEGKTRKANTALQQQIDIWKKLQNSRKPVITDVSRGAATTRTYGPGAIIQTTGGALATNPLAGVGSGGGGARPPIIPPPLIPKIPGGGGVLVPAGDAAIFWRRMMTGMLAQFRYATGYGSIIAANQIFGGMAQTATGARALGAAGLAGVGGATVATAGIMIALLAVVAALKALQITLQATIAASERARLLYAKSLNTGLGLQFSAQRGMLANTLGVSESDVYQFGAALAVLNPRLEDAAKIAAQSAQTLAPLSYEMRILKYDIEALFDAIGVKVVPALRLFIDLIDETVKSLTRFIQNVLIPLIAIAIRAAAPFASDQKIRNDIAALIAAVAGPFAEIIAKAIADASAAIPGPQAFMKQLPASAWEKMGLVTAMSGGRMVDYARRTAVATEKTAAHIMKLGGGIARAQQPFGINPAVSNP